MATKGSVRNLVAVAVLALGAIASLAIPLLKISRHESKPLFHADTLRCAIATDRHSSPMEFSAGYNYELMKHFCETLGKVPEIEMEREGENSLDSLLFYAPIRTECPTHGPRTQPDSLPALDIAVIPWSDSLVCCGNYAFSQMLPDSSVWVMAAGRREEVTFVNKWLETYMATEQYSRLEKRFRTNYNPFKRVLSGKKYIELSPYDSLIRIKAAEVGLPHSTLSALVWSESRFHIEAHSRKGAVGLMQMMPRTANRFEADNLLDPEENLSVGIAYLSHLMKKFQDCSDSSDERIKFVLGAYNAGEGRLRRCIRLADSLALPRSTWSEFCAAMSLMLKEAATDSSDTPPKRFNSRETVGFVASVTTLDSLFREIEISK